MRFLDTTGVRVAFDMRVAMADGTELSVDLYLPEQPGSYPALLTRTPYDNNRATSSPAMQTAATTSGEPGTALSDGFKLLAAHGYVVAAGDVRGRGDSGGRFTPFAHEAQDGAGTAAWLASHAECDGRVGLFGAGYAGFCALAAAAADPTGVACVAAHAPIGLDGLLWHNGVPRLDWLFWMNLTDGRLLQPPEVPPWPAVWRTLPVADMEDAVGRSGTPWREWLSHPHPDDAFWDPVRAGEIGVPTLLVTGWWDSQLRSTLRYRERARDARLVVGPWDHDGVEHPVRDLGFVDFGPRAVVDPLETLLGFFGEHLQGAAPAIITGVFVTGDNEWSAEPAATSERTLFLTSGGAANTLAGDGRLTTEPRDGEDAYTYDPAAPLPCQPSFQTFSRTSPVPFTLNQVFAEARDDCLVYTSDVLTQRLHVHGTPRVRLHAATDAPDTDWVVLLSDVMPDGRSVHLSHTIVRASSVEGFHPGETVRYDLDLTPVGHAFLPGHRIRACVTSSLHPLYARNLNTGQDVLTATEMRLAHQTVSHASELLLPVATAGA